MLHIPRTIGATTADLDRLASNADTGLEAAIPLPNVSSKILQKVIDYCKHHSEKKEGEAEEDKNFDAEFVKVDQATLFELILVRCDPEPAPSDPAQNEEILGRKRRPNRDLTFFTLAQPPQAANYLNIKSLLDLTCMTVANMIKGKTPEEIRKTFNIRNDFTPEEEEEVRRENQWAFE